MIGAAEDRGACAGQRALDPALGTDDARHALRARELCGEFLLPAGVRLFEWQGVGVERLLTVGRRTLRKTAARAPFHEVRRQEGTVRRGPAGDRFGHEIERTLGHVPVRLAHRCQARRCATRIFAIVEADHGDVVGDPDASLPQGSQCTEHRAIVGTDYRVEFDALVEQLGHRQPALLVVEIGDDHALSVERDAELRERVAVRAKADLGFRVVGGTAQKGDATPIVNGDQVQYRVAHARGVVGLHERVARDLDAHRANRQVREGIEKILHHGGGGAEAEHHQTVERLVRGQLEAAIALDLVARERVQRAARKAQQVVAATRALGIERTDHHARVLVVQRVEHQTDGRAGA